MKRYLFHMLSSAILLAGAGAAGAVGLPVPGAVTPQTVKVPDGPGSVRGLASDAQVSSFTGQVSYQIPIALPAGPAGFAPKLALAYSGALGNGPLGIGWTFGQVSVRRSLRLGVPSYTGADELDLVGLPGGTLVPIGNGQYRAEGQGNSIRGVAVDGGFELVDGAGTRYRLGTSDASRLASGALVAGWYLERVTDVAGHVIDYSYERRAGELYMTAITWGGANAFSAELVYEDRPDAVVSWRTGFRISTGRRLHAVVVHAFGGIRQTVQLTYDQTFALSRLATVRVVGSDGTATPTTTLSYAPATAGQVQVLGNTGGWSLGNNSISFFDVDKDGAMDLLRIESGNHRYRRNLGGTFGSEIVLANAPAVGMAQVRMLDLDGDSGAEMVLKSGSTWQSFRIVNNAWMSTTWPGSSTLDLPSVAVADLNGDNRMDVVTVSGSGVAVWFGTATGFASPRTLPAISASEPNITPNNVQFGDLNGDGLADALSVTSTGLIEFRGKGDGTFERVGAISYPWTGTTDTTQVRFADLDRDGLLDVVRIGTSQVFWYRGRPDGTFNVQPRVLDRPAGADASTVVALADANGNGSTDVVWSSPSGMWALDLAGPTNAGLLTAIDNGLGKTQRFEYTASTQLAWAAEAAGAPWTERIPVSIAVTTAATQVLASGEPDRTSLLDVRDGIYEQAERRFIGFARSIQTLPGGAAADTIRVFTQFHPGHGADRVLRGQTLSVRTEDGLGHVFRQVDNQVTALAVAGLAGDPRLKRAAVTQTRITTTEPGEPSAIVQTRFAFDAEARLFEERRDGRITDGVALDGDESIVRRTYTTEDATTGVRDLVCDELLLDGGETVVSHSQRLFGDDTSVTAAQCQPGKGWVREELSHLAEQDRWVSQKRTSYDSDGNPVRIYAEGVERTLGYDAHGLHPVRESVSPADGETLSWTATWDDVAGTLVGVAAPSGMTTQLTYDGIGRLTSIAANGALPHIVYRYDWLAPRPRTETFTFDGDPAALGPVPAPWTPDSGWRHSVSLTNGAGEQLLTAVQLTSEQWNISEFRQRDARGRVTALIAAFAFHGAEVTAVIPPADAATQTLRYDPLDRVVEQVLATGTRKRTTYHPLGVAVAIDGLVPMQSTLDGQGRILHTERTVEGTVESVDATYDAAGRILRFSLQGQVHHDFVYDSLGRLIHASDPDVGPRTMQYDDGGRLVTSENGAGEIVRYGYDDAGRLTSIDGTGIANRYHYDAPRSPDFDHTAGQLAWAEEATGEIDLGYDALGRLAVRQRTIHDAGATLVGREAIQLSLSGLPRSVDLGDGIVLPMRYDAAGRLAQIDGVWSIESYSPADLPMREQFGNGVIQRYERDIVNRPTRIAIENAGGALYDVAASYTAHGAIATLTDHDHAGLDHTTAFDYDSAGRLTGATIGTGQAALPFRYAYDGLQNMIRRDAPRPAELGILAGSYQYSSEAPRQLAQIVDDGGKVLARFAYDAAGRQVQHGDQHLTYNALSQLIRVDGVAGGSVEHRYGYDGQRVATRSTSGAMTYWITPSVVVRGGERDHYVRVGDRLVAKITTSAANAAAAAAATGIARSRIALAGLALAWTLGLTGLALRQHSSRRLRAALASGLALLAILGGCRSPVASRTSALGGPPLVYYHPTYAAGPQLTTNAAGDLQEERRTEPFGAAIDAFRDGAVQPVDYRLDPINSLNKFSDPETGWSDHGARWLAPDVGQWSSPDPPATAPDPKFMAAPWKLHPYQYVDQNPVAYWDPDGQWPDSIAWETLEQSVRLTFPTAGPVVAALAASTAEVVLPVAGLLGLGWIGSKVAEASPEMAECGGQAECASAMYMAHLANEEAHAQAQAQAQAATKADLISKRTGPIVFRALTPDEHPIPGVTGLIARAPGAGNSPMSHVLGKIDSQWISTTKSWVRALEKFGGKDSGVAAIDLSKVSTTIVDLSAGMPGASPSSQAWRRVVSDQEVLIQNEVPADAIIWSTKQ